ncbi:hypothetical protein LO762_27430 [Actinocorallia sp. API 0066]|uniref:hypothetical protein n=1 Tax=Actinocorallia sp. API 0066 TaxID=2896846 RepID=UPI001E44F21D|nr:hypothetical protein [Actinocorallia sp. API 0066]MCD0452885.1 hypothetical protein [Actinocorallia sp. API 0066]
MGEPPSAVDLAGYLAAAGWRPLREFRGGVAWGREGGHEILVPVADAKDGARRVREALAVLGTLEGRPSGSVAADVGTPAADVQWYRTGFDPGADGQLGLGSALATLEGAQGVLAAAARAVLGGPRTAFEGPAPRAVRELLGRVRVAQDAGRLTLRIPLDPGDDPLGRRVALLLRDALPRLADAVAGGEAAAFDGLVGAGVSADLCRALARFAGPDPGAAFTTGFRWARTLTPPPSTEAAVFGPGAGRLLRHGAFRLRRLRFTGQASVTGRVISLVDNGGQDRFRVHVHGEMTEPEGGTSRRALWVRLHDAAAYGLAIAAHRDAVPVVARGLLVTAGGRPELVTGPGDFQPLPGAPPPRTH